MSGPAMEVVVDNTVQKPVGQPTKARPPRTGKQPVVKAAREPRPKLSKEERQRLKFLITTRPERDLLDKLLQLATEPEAPLGLSDGEREVAARMLKRSKERGK